LVGEENEGIIIRKWSHQGISSRASATRYNNNWKEDEVSEEGSVREQSAERRKELTCPWRIF